MNRDELKEKIKAIIIEAREEDHHGNLLMYSDEATDLILFLLAPEFTDAEKWRRIEGAYNSSPPCDCPEWDSDKAECMIEAAHCPFNDVVQALEGEGEKR
jgi:hypothetical protein